MNSSENIRNALHVIYKTYKNVEKLIEFTKVVSQEKTDYRTSVPKFMRYKSDNETTGWLLNDFILLFQNIKANDCESENGWKDAPVYAMEIYLGDEDYAEDDFPAIYLSKFEYDEINGWNEGCSPASHWVFFFPLRDPNDMKFSFENDITISVPKNEKVSKSYWGLKKVTTKKLDLFEVTSDNLEEKIFGTFDELANLL